MRCGCCDRELSSEEIQWNEDIQNWEMCTTCLMESLDAAFSGGFTIDDEDEEYVLIEDDFDDKYSESLMLFGYTIDREKEE